jgi:hypothetical protein
LRQARVRLRDRKRRRQCDRGGRADKLLPHLLSVWPREYTDNPTSCIVSQL